MPDPIKSNPILEKILEMGLEESPVTLTGYPLVSNRSDKVHLYQGLSPSTYLEIDKDDIIYAGEGETDTDPAVFLVKPQSQIKFVSTLKATPTPDPWRPDPHPYGLNIGQIPVLTPTSGEVKSAYIGTAVQLSPKKCRILPLFQFIRSKESGIDGESPGPIVGYVLDCSY